VLIPNNIKIPFKASYGPDETPVTGEIIDLSTEGSGIMLDSHIFVRNGKRIRASALQMPKGITVTTDIEIRTTRPCARDDRMMRVGVRFISPNRETQKQIRKTVLLLEEIQKKQKK
jgi:c-di-GMP-binding flagellar brake protein YcgR